MEIDFDNPKWRLKARATTLFQRHGSNLGFDYAEAERMVKNVIETKEGPHEVNLGGSNGNRSALGHGV